MVTLTYAAPSWTDTGGFWIALGALLFAIAAFVVSLSTARSSRRSADAAEGSEVAAHRSADAARSSADSAERVAKAEESRDHEMYRPHGPADPGFIHVPNERTHQDNLFFEFTAPWGYRVAGDAINNAGGQESRSRLSIGPVMQAGRPVRIYVGNLDNSPLPALLNLRFWPPADGDPGESWTCRCGRPGDPEGPAHWEWNVPVPQDANYTIRDSLG